ncbi:hypothetical protein GOODEAATRI_026104 [Goodea atripinnis]|uniref:Clarin 1 n=1 Tax=Goodea atripinnis TaxID=208336 RepID=A0ABV0PH46_9TELE
MKHQSSAAPASSVWTRVWTRRGAGGVLCDSVRIFRTRWSPPHLRPRQPDLDPLLFSSIMPNRQKQVLFCSAGLLSLCCALSAAVITGLPFWLRGAVLCRTGAELVNATGAELDQFLGELSYGLFHGERVKQCGLGGRPSRFSCESHCGSMEWIRTSWL